MDRWPWGNPEIAQFEQRTFIAISFWRISFENVFRVHILGSLPDWVLDISEIPSKQVLVAPMQSPTVIIMTSVSLTILTTFVYYSSSTSIFILHNFFHFLFLIWTALLDKSIEQLPCPSCKAMLFWNFSQQIKLLFLFKQFS